MSAVERAFTAGNVRDIPVSDDSERVTTLRQEFLELVQAKLETVGISVREGNIGSPGREKPLADCVFRPLVRYKVNFALPRLPEIFVITTQETDASRPAVTIVSGNVEKDRLDRQYNEWITAYSLRLEMQPLFLTGKSVGSPPFVVTDAGLRYLDIDNVGLAAGSRELPKNAIDLVDNAASMALIVVDVPEIEPDKAVLVLEGISPEHLHIVFGEDRKLVSGSNAAGNRHNVEPPVFSTDGQLSKLSAVDSRTNGQRAMNSRGGLSKLRKVAISDQARGIGRTYRHKKDRLRDQAARRKNKRR